MSSLLGVVLPEEPFDLPEEPFDLLDDLLVLLDDLLDLLDERWGFGSFAASWIGNVNSKQTMYFYITVCV